MALRRKTAFVLAAIVAVSALPHPAQGRIVQGRVAGTVLMSDGTRLPGALVAVEGTARRAMTDANGAFAFDGLPAGKATLAVSLDGFEPKKARVEVRADGTTSVDIVLEIAKEAREASVAAEKTLLSVSDKENRIIITPSQIAALPGLGEKDIFRAFQLLPGISGSNETSSGLFVRGGKPDQNLILYDGFPVYHVDHLFGYYSAFNMEAIQDARLSKGGFEAKYGGRLSSVMELAGKEGATDAWHAGTGVSFLSADALVEVPLFGRGSLLLAGRRSFQSPLYDKIMDLFNVSPAAALVGRKAAGRLAQFESQPKSYFYDLNGKLAFDLSSRDRITASLYNGRDDLDNSRVLTLPSSISDLLARLGLQIDTDISDLTNWRNTGASVAWARRWSEAFQTTLRATYSRYDNDRDWSVNVLLQSAAAGSSFEPRSYRRGSIENNSLKDAGFKLENTLALGARHAMEFGLEASWLDVAYDYRVESADESDATAGRRVLAPRSLVSILNRRDRGILAVGYVQDRWTPTDRLTVTPGLRLTSFDRTKSVYGEPRLSLSWRLSDRLKATASWGRFYQFVSDATREDVVQGNREFWVLADGQGIPVGAATHYIAGLSYKTVGWLLDAQGFYKDLSGLSEFAPRIVRATAGQDYSQYFYKESGTAKGIEILLQKKSGRYTGWLSYTLSRVEYEAPQLSDAPFPALQDQTHEFKIVNFLELGPLTLSGTWIFATGKPTTPPLGVDQVPVGSRLVDRVVIGGKNSARLPDYHRLDLSVTCDLKVLGAASKLGLTLFNVYDRKNVWYREFDIQQHQLVQNDIQFMGFVLNLFLSVRI